MRFKHWAALSSSSLPPKFTVLVLPNWLARWGWPAAAGRERAAAGERLILPTWEFGVAPGGSWVDHPGTAQRSSFPPDSTRSAHVRAAVGRESPTPPASQVHSLSQHAWATRQGAACVRRVFAKADHPTPEGGSLPLSYPLLSRWAQDPLLLQRWQRLPPLGFLRRWLPFFLVPDIPGGVDALLELHPPPVHSLDEPAGMVVHLLQPL